MRGRNERTLDVEIRRSPNVRTENRCSPLLLGRRRDRLYQPPRADKATIPLQYPSRARGRRDYALLIRAGMRVKAG